MINSNGADEQLPQHILEEIEKRGLSPRPRSHFLLKRGVFWSLAVLSVILGGIAVTIISYVFFDHDAKAYRYLNQSFIKDLLLAIPYFWLALLAVFAAVAKYSFRHTKTGYRYPTAKIVAVVFAASLLFGLALNGFDAGEKINNFLTEAFPPYNSLVYTSKDAWSQPEKGLLGGTVVAINNANEFTLRDFKNNIWHITIDPNELDGLKIDVGSVIKMVGVKGRDMTFQAKQIFSWGN